MGMPDTARRYTVDEVLAFPNDGNRYELVDGELLVTPAPTMFHLVVLSRLHAALQGYLSLRTDVMALFSPADITWDREKLVRSPYSHHFSAGRSPFKLWLLGRARPVRAGPLRQLWNQALVEVPG